MAPARKFPGKCVIAGKKELFVASVLEVIFAGANCGFVGVLAGYWENNL